MISLRCTTDKYDALYARYLANPGTLLDLAGYEPGMRLLDLCGGTGAVSLEALRRGAPDGSVYLLDLNPRCPDSRVHQVQGDANHLSGVSPEDIPIAGFDLIVIRQSLAYLNICEALGVMLAAFLRDGGKLVFNTFDWPVDTKPYVTKRYLYEGSSFFEASVKMFGRVFHLQHRRGTGTDLNYFYNWHGVAIIRMVLPHFDFKVHKQGNSRRWVCTRKRGSR